MQYFKYLFFLTITLSLLFACKKSDNNIISKEKLAQITVELYLADEYIEQNSEYTGMADTLEVYSAIIEHNGYTQEEYENSVREYLKNKNEYVKILQLANNMVNEKVEKLSELLDIETKSKKPIWVLREIDKTHIQDLELRPYYRSIKWLTKQNDTIIWRVREDAIKDIPTNIYWWKNNILVNKNDTLPTLTKEYIIKGLIKEREEARKKLYANGASALKDKTEDTLKKLPLNRLKNFRKGLELKKNDIDNKTSKEQTIDKVDPRTGNPILKVN